MSIIASRDTAPRYKLLFPFGERRSILLFFYRLSRGSRSGLYYSQDGDAEWRTAALRVRTRDYTFARAVRQNFQRGELKVSVKDREMIQRKIRKK